MPQPQFDAKVTSADGKMLLFIRGPFTADDGIAFQLRMVAVSEMGQWAQIWKGEEERDETVDTKAD